MSGYNNYDCGYEQSWDYNDCHKPRRHGRRRHQKRYDGCWDSYSHCS